MNKCLSNLDSRADKQRFLEANHAAFMIPKKFDAATYQNKIDEVRPTRNKKDRDIFFFLFLNYYHIFFPLLNGMVVINITICAVSGRFRIDDGTAGA